MTREMTATEVKAKFLALLDEVEAGEEIRITRRGRTVAKLTPATGPHSLKGLFNGLAITAADEDDLYTTEAAWGQP
jgi:prevent-host-death family protein